MALAILGISTVAVYLTARHVGSLAAAFVAGVGLMVLTLVYERDALRIVRALERQAHLASIDDLTGLANDRSLREAIRSRGVFRALATLDVDQFKPYNDAFGHPAGDAALRQVGKILREVVGERALVFRVGGDEFAVLFPIGDGLDPVDSAEAIVRTVAEHPWPLRPITVSIGLALADPDEPSSLLDRADRSLYRGKREGGNRVCIQPAEGLQSG